MEKFLYLHLEHADEDMPNGIFPTYICMNTGLITALFGGAIINGTTLVSIQFADAEKSNFKTEEVVECKTNDQYVEIFLTKMGIEVVLEHG